METQNQGEIVIRHTSQGFYAIVRGADKLNGYGVYKHSTWTEFTYFQNVEGLREHIATHYPNYHEVSWEDYKQEYNRRFAVNQAALVEDVKKRGRYYSDWPRPYSSK